MFDSQTDVSASISAGTTPFGLRRRYSGVRFPPNSPPTSSIWKAIPSSVRSHVTFWTLADVLRPRSLSMKRSCRRNRHAACDCRARADGIEPSLDVGNGRSEEHTSELQSLMRISYAVFCLKKKKNKKTQQNN